jgi:hypothetical protein
MTIQLSITARNDRLLAIASAFAAGVPTLNIYAGAPPANCASTETGTLLMTYNLAATGWIGTPSNGSTTFANLPLSGSASGTGTAGHFRIYDSAAICHMQGTCTLTGGGGDMTLDNTSINSGQTVNVTGFTLSDANA